MLTDYLKKPGAALALTKARLTLAAQRARRPAQASPCAHAGCWNQAEQGSDFCMTHEPPASTAAKEKQS